MLEDNPPVIVLSFSAHILPDDPDRADCVRDNGQRCGEAYCQALALNVSAVRLHEARGCRVGFQPGFGCVRSGRFLAAAAQRDAARRRRLGRTSTAR